MNESFSQYMTTRNRSERPAHRTFQEQNLKFEGMGDEGVVQETTRR